MKKSTKKSAIVYIDEKGYITKQGKKLLKKVIEDYISGLVTVFEDNKTIKRCLKMNPNELKEQFL